MSLDFIMTTKPRQTAAKHAMAQFARGRASRATARRVMVWAGLTESYVAKLLDGLEMKRRLALDARNAAAKRRREHDRASKNQSP